MGRRLIDADALIELIDGDIASLGEDMSREGYACLCTLKMAKQYINVLPTVPLDWKSLLDDWTEMIAKGREIERKLNGLKHGRWIEVSDGLGYVGEPCEACSVCGMQTDYPSNYCPNCGARMDGEEK